MRRYTGSILRTGKERVGSVKAGKGVTLVTELGCRCILSPLNGEGLPRIC